MCLVLCIAPAYWTFLLDLLFLADCSHLFTIQEERSHVNLSAAPTLSSLLIGHKKSDSFLQ